MNSARHLADASALHCQSIEFNCLISILMLAVFNTHIADEKEQSDY